MTTAVPVWRELDQPRSLTTDECSALAELVRGARSAFLSDQAATAMVSAVCACGCSSLRLATSGAPLSADAILSLEPENRDDYAGIEAVARDSFGAQIAVTLHIVEGRIHELEFFAGEGVATSWPLTWT